MRARLTVLVFVFSCFQLGGQVIYPYRTCVSPKELTEFSGIAKVDKNELAGINDGGNKACLYFMDTLGKLKRKRCFAKVPNIDWEEICYSNGSLVICDVGDNLCSRKEMFLHYYDIKKDTITATKKIQFAEKSKPPLAKSRCDFDCEAVFAIGDRVCLFSKSHSNPYTGKSYQYTIEKTDKKTVFKAVDSTEFGKKGFIHNSLTGAAISTKNIMAFISCTHVWIKFPLSNEKSLFKNVTLSFDFDGLTQKEAITFISDYRFVVADERTAKIMGGRMYFFDIRPYMNGNKKYSRKHVKSASVKKSRDSKTFTLKSVFTSGGKNLSIAFFDKNANCIYTQEIPAAMQTIAWDKEKSIADPAKVTAFWLIEGNQVVYAGKVEN